MNPKQHKPKQTHLPSVFPCLSSYLIVWFQAVTYVLGSVLVHPEQISYIHRRQRRWKVRLPLLVSLTSLLFLVRETTETEFCWPLVLICFVQEQIQHEWKKNRTKFSDLNLGVSVCTHKPQLNVKNKTEFSKSFYISIKNDFISYYKFIKILCVHYINKLFNISNSLWYDL